MTPIDELPKEIWALARGYTRGDEKETMAVLMRAYQNRPYREIEQETGVEFSKIKRLAKGFGELCDQHHERRSA